MANELVVINEKTDIAKLFKPESIDDILVKIREEVKSFVPDLSTSKGRKDIASFAMKVTKSKTLIDGAGKKYVADLKAMPKKVDAERKRLRDECDLIRDEVRLPLTEWENVRKDVDEKIRRLGDLIHGSVANSCLAAEQVERLLYFSDYIVPDKKEEFDRAMSFALSTQFGFLSSKITEENEAEELERLRAEEEKRKAKESEDERIKAAEKRATEKAEKESRERELQLKLDKEQAENRADKAEALVDITEKNVEEKVAILVAEFKREPSGNGHEENTVVNHTRLYSGVPSNKLSPDENKQHRAKIESETEASYRINGYSSEEAKRLTSLLVAGKIKHGFIEYS